MKIGVITDAHANLPALNAALTAMDAAGCEHIVHCGDAIGIGPHPREVMKVLLTRRDMTLVAGNHDHSFAGSPLTHRPTWMPEMEFAHHQWVHAQLDPSWREIVRHWPLAVTQRYGTATVTFTHYGWNDGYFGPISKENLPAELDEAFRPTTDIVFFGHHHPQADRRGRSRYINPGALGCHADCGARFAIIEAHRRQSPTVTLHAAPYDATSVYRDLDDRRVPHADFIKRVFLSKDPPRYV